MLVPFSFVFLFGSCAAIDVKTLMRSEPKKVKSSSIIRADSQYSMWEDALKLDPSQLGRCSSVFMDIGASTGTHVRKLFEPEKYPHSPYMEVFDTVFGLPQNRSRPSAETGICAFGIETDPRYTSVLQSIEQAYQKKGWHVKFFSPIAGENSSGTLRDNLNADPTHSDWADVSETSLANFLQLVSAYSKPGFKFMRMEIGSSEYKVLRRFLEDRVLCQDFLNKLAIKWHETAVHLIDVPSALKLQLQLEYPDHNVCGPHGKPTEVFSNLDDEPYVSDGTPLP